jgi:hypothetical protein
MRRTSWHETRYERGKDKGKKDKDKECKDKDKDVKKSSLIKVDLEGSGRRQRC